MAIRPTCDRCGKELEAFGGILLGPPEADGRVEKLHLCPVCYTEIRAGMRGNAV